MNKFNCKICNKQHTLVTLFEFPEPETISQITTGERKGTIHNVAKYLFVVDKVNIFIRTKLIINIVDYEDELEMLVWTEIKPAAYAEKFKNLKEIDELKLLGELHHPIPFYENKDLISVEILDDLNGRNSNNPIVSKVITNHQLRNDFLNGISLDHFTTLLSRMYHI